MFRSTQDMADFLEERIREHAEGPLPSGVHVALPHICYVMAKAFEEAAAAMGEGTLLIVKPVHKRLAKLEAQMDRISKAHFGLEPGEKN